MNRITERIDRITLLTDAYRSTTPPVPKSVKIELTARIQRLRRANLAEDVRGTVCEKCIAYQE